MNCHLLLCCHTSSNIHWTGSISNEFLILVVSPSSNPFLLGKRFPSHFVRRACIYILKHGAHFTKFQETTADIHELVWGTAPAGVFLCSVYCSYVRKWYILYVCCLIWMKISDTHWLFSFVLPVDVGFFHHSFHAIVELEENHVLGGWQELFQSVFLTTQDKTLLQE